MKKLWTGVGNASSGISGVGSTNVIGYSKYNWWYQHICLVILMAEGAATTGESASHL